MDSRSITPEGSDDWNCRQASSGVGESQFCIHSSRGSKSSLDRRLEMVDALGPRNNEVAHAGMVEAENEQQFREKIDIAARVKEAGNLDDARQQLLVLVFDPCLPTGVMLELAAALSKVDLARFSLTLCERLMDSDSENAEIAYDLAVYSSMCGKPQYVTEMYLLKACEHAPKDARYRLAFVCWLLGSQRSDEAVIHSGSPEQFDSKVAVCSDCLSWVTRKFTEQGNAALASAWSNSVLASDRKGLSDCCRNFREPGQLRRAW